jgi:hypothetical protein
MMRTAPRSDGARLRRWLAISAVFLALAVAACGTKSRPELPEGQTDQYPRQYPNPNEP